VSLLLVTTVKVSAVLLAALGLSRLLRQQSAAVRHWLVATGIAGAFLMPVLVLVVPAWHVASLPTRGPEVTTNVAFSVGEQASAAAIPPAVRPAHRVDPGILAVGLWLTGAAAGLGVLLVGLVRLAALARAAQPAGDDRGAAIARSIAREYGVSRPLRLLYGSDPSLLATWGLLRPTVMLPAAARGWPDDRLRVVLCHELAHIRRGDWGTQLMADVLRAVYWFNPLAWLACRHLRQQSEHACDDAVLHAGVAAPAYASQLLDLARAYAAPRPAWSPALPVARPSGLERRVRAMLNSQLNRLPLTRRARLATTLAASLIALVIAGAGAAAQGPFASVSGSLVDPQRAALPGATLTITNAATQAKNEVRSDGAGRFELVGLPPGDYVLDIVQPGFRPYRTNLTLNGERIDRDIVMSVATLQETITVSPGPASGLVTIESDAARGKRMAARVTSPCTPNTVAAPGTALVGGKLRPPMKLRDVRPIYPDAQISGTVEMDAVIGVDGSVRDITVTKSAHPALDASAIEAVRQWQFSETLLNCVPIEVTMKVSTSFTGER
jgi:TonB family protein